MKKIFLVFFIFISFVNAQTDYEKALILIKNKHIQKAHKILLKEKKKGNLEAFYTLGQIYLSKNTIFYDKIEAYNHFVEAANKGNAKSQLIIGRFFLQGKIVKKDYKKAMYYFKEASKQKLYKANCYIAYMYANGLGVFPNFGRANVFAKDGYKKGYKLCKKVWKDFHLEKYPKDKSFKFGKYLKPVK
ncbi:MAG: sel1 repeat family protein [Arcobacter sp.]|nr:sel1 repeat family protein [Arcobacter sp.]